MNTKRVIVSLPNKCTMQSVTIQFITMPPKIRHALQLLPCHKLCCHSLLYTHILHIPLVSCTPGAQPMHPPHINWISCTGQPTGLTVCSPAL